MPHASTLIRTSPAAGCGISRSTSSNSPPAFPTCATRFFAISLSPSQSPSGSGFWMPSLPTQLEIPYSFSCSSHFLAPTSRTVPSANSNLNPRGCHACVCHAFPWSPTSSKNAVLPTPTPSPSDFLKRAHEAEKLVKHVKDLAKGCPLSASLDVLVSQERNPKKASQFKTPEPISIFESSFYALPLPQFWPSAQLSVPASPPETIPNDVLLFAPDLLLPVDVLRILVSRRLQQRFHQQHFESAASLR